MTNVQITTNKSENVTTATSMSSWRDSLGIIASIGCAIHCAAMPFVIAYLPMLGLSFLADEAFHKWMALICFLIAIAAFVPGIKKHGNWIPVSIAAFGLVFITFAAFGLAGECCASCAAAPVNSACADAECDQCDSCSLQTGTVDTQRGELTVALATEAEAEKGLLSTLAPWITPFGGILLVSAHLLNRRYGCLCGCCPPASA